MQVPLRLGVDVGGTFTDFALVDDSTGRVATHKQLTTPNDPADAVLSGIDELLKCENRSISDIGTVVHGTTLITNAVIERKGARTGMLVTDGFRDVLDVAMESRYDLFDLRIQYAEPVVPRRLRAPVIERLRHDGSVETPLDLASVERSLDLLVHQEGIEALAICLLHSYVDPVHENAIADIVRDNYPKLQVCTSAQVVPVMREYDRWSTATVNAYAQPLASRYLGRIQIELNQRGFHGAFLIMTSSGGTVTPDQASRFPVRLIESGPAAGALMSAFIGQQAGYEDILSFDMGGTTAKGAIVRGGKPLKRYRLEVAREHEFRAGSGLPLRIPVIDMIEIGAGGGSLAAVDPRGLLAVGPHSAGAEPGPACYARGGTQPTLTDANTTLGYLIPERFLGGTMALDLEAAQAALREHVAHPLALDVARAAWGVHEVINEDVARAFRMHASELGFDYRQCTMVAFGGSGPVHALRVARKLGIPRVLFPPAAGVMSAIGLLVTPLSFESLRSERVRVSELDGSKFAAQFTGLEAQAREFLEAAGVDAPHTQLQRRLDMRYVGQGYEVEVELPADFRSTEQSSQWLEAALTTLFDARYTEVFSSVTLTQPLEIINWKVEATGPTPAVGADYGAGFYTPDAPTLPTHPVYDAEQNSFADCPVVERYGLGPGTTLTGPLLLQERESTCVIGAGEKIHVDAAFNLVADLIADQRSPNDKSESEAGKRHGGEA